MCMNDGRENTGIILSLIGTFFGENYAGIIGTFLLQSIHFHCVMVSLCTFLFGIHIRYVKWIRIIAPLPWLLPCCVESWYVC